MFNLDDYNRAFLAGRPDLAKKIAGEIRAMKRARPKAIVMSLHPKYAKAIYEGRKQWEFRKTPPPLFKDILIYESDPVSKITGRVWFCESFTGLPIVVWDFVKRNRIYTQNLTGITLEKLEEYAGDKLVTALRVHKAARFDHDIGFDCKPPQNWGTFVAKYKDGSEQ